MDIQIRKAETKDLPFIEEKLKNYILDSTAIDWTQFFAARIKDKTVAFGRIIDHGDSFEIASLGVDYYHRKRGIGRKITSFLVQEIRKRDPQKPIYGVTHLKQFLVGCGFTQVEDNYPDYLDHKRKHICKLDESRFTVMKYNGGLAQP